MADVFHYNTNERAVKPVIHTFDFDSFIFINDPENWRRILGVHPLAKPCINFLQKEVGDYTIGFTCREGPELTAAVAYLKAEGIEFPTVNDNAPFMKEIFQNNPRKVYADYYWDDHRGCRCGWEAVQKVVVKRYMETHRGSKRKDAVNAFSECFANSTAK